MEKSTVDKLIEYFKYNVAYLNFLLGKKSSLFKDIVYQLLIAFTLVATVVGFALIVLSFPVYIIFLPN